VKKVVSHLTWIEPMSGMVISDFDQEANGSATSPAPGPAPNPAPATAQAKP
jgi:hypothetical protein